MGWQYKGIMFSNKIITFNHTMKSNPCKNGFMNVTQMFFAGKHFLFGNASVNIFIFGYKTEIAII
jgi:hypothetical protein